MEGQKKMIEQRGSNNSKSYGDNSNVSRKNKKMKKEGEIRKGVMETNPAAEAAEEKWTYDGGYGGGIEVNNVPVVMGADQHNYQEHEDWRAWLRPGMLVDEQMSWGSTWFSFWEADNANCNEFYNDVMEDDLWDLKSIQNTPK